MKPMDMPDPGLQQEIIELVTETLNIAVPAADTDLLASGTMDSLLLVELLMQLENRYGVRISADNLDFEHFRSVASIAAFVGAERQAG